MRIDGSLKRTKYIFRPERRREKILPDTVGTPRGIMTR